MTKKNRVPIPQEISNEAMFLSDNTCCICREPRKAVQTHHIDEDPSNSNDLDNLAVLCLQCHDQTMHKGGFGRKLNSGLVIKYRDSWYDCVKQKRKNAITTSQAPSNTYYDDLDDTELNYNKTLSFYSHFSINFSFEEFKDAIENYLDLSTGEQKVLAKILKDYRKNHELNIPKILRKNDSYIYEINNLKNDDFLSFYSGWESLGMDSDGFITDPNEDITLAVGIKDGWSLTQSSEIINEIYLYFNANNQVEFNKTLCEEVC